MKKSQSWHKDGINMQEWLAIAYFIPWFAIGCLFAWKAYTVGLTKIDVDWFYIVSWPTLLSACFYYGFKVVLSLGRKTSTKAASKISQLPDQIFNQPQSGDWRTHI